MAFTDGSYERYKQNTFPFYYEIIRYKKKTGIWDSIHIQYPSCQYATIAMKVPA